MGVLLRRFPAGSALTTWVLGEVTVAGTPLSSPFKSEDVCPWAASSEAAGSELTEPLAVGLIGPLGVYGATRLATTAVYAGPPSEEPICRAHLVRP